MYPRGRGRASAGAAATVVSSLPGFLAAGGGRGVVPDGDMVMVVNAEGEEEEGGEAGGDDAAGEACACIKKLVI